MLNKNNLPVSLVSWNVNVIRSLSSQRALPNIISNATFCSTSARASTTHRVVFVKIPSAFLWSSTYPNKSLFGDTREPTIRLFVDGFGISISLFVSRSQNVYWLFSEPIFSNTIVPLAILFSIASPRSSRHIFSRRG